MIDVKQTDEFKKWLKGLKDPQARAQINVRIRRGSITGNFGDVEPVGDKVFEMRFHLGPGYRVYFAERGSEIILLLSGGDKSSQQRDIEKAKKLNKKYQ